MLLMRRLVFFVKRRTEYELLIGDCDSDVCSSDLSPAGGVVAHPQVGPSGPRHFLGLAQAPGRDPFMVTGEQRLRHRAALPVGWPRVVGIRSEERRLGAEVGSTCRSGWSTCH